MRRSTGVPPVKFTAKMAVLRVMGKMPMLLEVTAKMVVLRYRPFSSSTGEAKVRGRRSRVKGRPQLAQPVSNQFSPQATSTLIGTSSARALTIS